MNAPRAATLTSDPQAQQGLIYTALLWPEVLTESDPLPVAALWPAASWETAAWGAMLERLAAGQPIDPVLVGGDLKRAGWDKAATLLAGLVNDAAGVADNHSAYADRVRECWERRQALQAIEGGLLDLARGESVSGLLEGVTARLAAINTSSKAKATLADRLLPVMYAEDLDAPMAEFPWLIESLGMMRGRPLILSGYGDAGKTFAAQELMLAVARGDRLVWGSLVVNLAGPVVHIDLEQQLEMTRWRYRRLAFGKGYKLSSLGRRLELSSLPPMKLTDPEAKAALVERCTGKALCLIDNLTAGTPGLDENSKAMAAPLYMLNEVSAATGCTILLIHHEGKTGEMPKSAAQRIRGHSSIHGALGGGVSFTKQPDGSIKIEQAKQSMGEGEPVHFRFEDRGVIEPATKKAEGIELVWMPREQMAQEGTAKTDEQADRAFNQLVVSVLGIVKRNPGIGGSKPIAARLERSEPAVRAAFEELANTGRIENRGGKPPRCRWYAAEAGGG
jgi:hypothetical protein